MHVVLRTVREVGRLRCGKGYRAVRHAVFRAAGKHDFRVVHVSIQANHIHLLCEADDRHALATGMQGLAIAAARRLNRELSRRGARRRGTVFADRYHATVITSPAQARNALSYVLNNWRRHREDLEGTRERAALVDPYSSGIRFGGWRGLRQPFALPEGYQPLPVVPPTTWLFATGWRRGGEIGWSEVPGTV